MKDTVEQIKPTAWLIPIERSVFFYVSGIESILIPVSDGNDGKYQVW